LHCLQLKFGAQVVLHIHMYWKLWSKTYSCSCRRTSSRVIQRKEATEFLSPHCTRILTDVMCRQAMKDSVRVCTTLILETMSCVMLENIAWLHTLYNSKVNPKKCRHSHFVAYKWQHPCLGDRGRQFFIHWFLGQLVKLVVHHIQFRNHHERSFSFCKIEFCKKTDDHVVYFEFFDYIC
jgi:hypothetical protein